MEMVTFEKQNQKEKNTQGIQVGYPTFTGACTQKLPHTCTLDFNFTSNMFFALTMISFHQYVCPFLALNHCLRS